RWPIETPALLGEANCATARGGTRSVTTNAPHRMRHTEAQRQRDNPKNSSGPRCLGVSGSRVNTAPSVSRLDVQQHPRILIGEHIEQSVRTLSNVADPLA